MGQKGPVNQSLGASGLVEVPNPFAVIINFSILLKDDTMTLSLLLTKFPTCEWKINCT